MKKCLCCFKGESSSQGGQHPRGQHPQGQAPQVQASQVQDPQGQAPQGQAPEGQEPSRRTDSSEIKGSESEEFDEEHPFGDNEPLNNSWRNFLKNQKDRPPPDSSPNHPQASSPALIPHSGVSFQWLQILDGTVNLSLVNFLGRGNFGEVYRCHFPTTNTYGAAKIQNFKNPEAHPEFAAEIMTLHTANHPNVIKLLGKCFEKDHRVIVYEYMPKGSLDHYLYANTRPKQGPGRDQEYPVLSWVERLKIALGVAEALVYLHEGLKIIHRDVKASNVLLDEDLVPRLTDFGLATKMVVDDNNVEKPSKIYPIKGTPGCIAPEAKGSGLVTSMSDVYSYGVFLFTLFTGRKAFDRQRAVEKTNITDWLMPVWSKQEYMPMVLDAALGNSYSVEGLSRLFQAARMCTDPQALARPKMAQVESMIREAAGHEVTVCRPLVTERCSV